MLKIVEPLIRKRATLCLLCMIALPSIPVSGTQQPKDSSPVAPLPTPIATAQKVFISNAPGDSLPASLGGPARPYQEFYAAMKSWGHYQLAFSPAGADLILEISFSHPIVGVKVMSTSGGGSTSVEKAGGVAASSVGERRSIRTAPQQPPNRGGSRIKQQGKTKSKSFQEEKIKKPKAEFR